jgi:serine/threonine protein kinase
VTSNNQSGIVSGQKSPWSLLKKLGEGDAGEVYLVESLVEQRLAILKRPKHSVFTGEVRRQSEQIRTEGRILKALETLLGALPDGRVSAPALLDQSKPGSEFGEAYFIVIERAQGFDLSFLARISRMGLSNTSEIEATPGELAFLQEIAYAGKLPERILLAALHAIFVTFDTIHSTLNTAEIEAQGILWNDVKSDHLFWNPHTASYTIIDWGNGRFIEANALTRSHRHTPADDRVQFIDEMCRFLAQAAPELQTRLGWPTQVPASEDFNPVYAALHDRVAAALAEANIALAALRKEEAELVQPGPQADQALLRIEELHLQIVALGEVPDYEAALRLAAGSAGTLASAGEMDRVQRLCTWAASLPGAPAQSWRLLANLAQAAVELPEAMRKNMVEAVQAAAANDWKGVLWGMMAALQSNPEPEWWYEMVQQARIQASDETTAAIRPFLSLRRLALTLQSYSQQLEDRLARTPSPEEEQRLAAMNALLATLRRVVQNWVQPEPFPPYSGLGYAEIETLFNSIEAVLSGGGLEMQRVLNGSRAQVNTILEAWGRKEFVTAAQGLRYLLVLDPDRRRLLRADAAVQTAPDWIQRVQNGPRGGEHLSEFVTSLEYEGRELRNQVGPAGWLDGTLEGLKALRQGAWPGDLLAAQPALLAEMPWLQKFERSEVLLSLLHPTLPPAILPAIHGFHEARYGPDGELCFIEPMDAWMPEARGSSARVYLSTYRGASGEQREAALKIMRADKAEYALPLFREEVRVLLIMQDVPGVARMLECGFLWMGGAEGKLPADHNLAAIQAMRGDVLRIGPDAVERFLGLLENRVREGWIPYLLVEKRKREDSMLLLCDAGLNRGRFLAVPDLLFMSIQICDILHIAHQRNVVYRDHKILHYYWLPDLNGISIIDWNVARYHPEGLTPYDVHMDLVQLGARGLHHILTGRTAPGALPMGPTRPEEIERAAQSYAAQWTYDDQRLSVEVRVILEQLLSGGYTSAADLSEDLKRAYMNLS